MLRQFTAALRQAGIRRALSVFVAVVLLWSTFIHATHHCAVAADASVQVEMTAHDGAPDGSDKAPEAGHCCTCSTAAMIVAESPFAPATVPTRIEAVAWLEPHPYVPAAEVRPPIA